MVSMSWEFKKWICREDRGRFGGASNLIVAIARCWRIEVVLAPRRGVPTVKDLANEMEMGETMACLVLEAILAWEAEAAMELLANNVDAILSGI